MGQLVLLVVAAAWAAVLVPPLLRSRIENRPNSSVSDFRNQLSSLQRAMPSRGVAMRSMARPLAPSPLSRPAAAGRPGIPGHSRTHGGQPPRLNGHVPVDRRRRAEPVRTYDASPRVRSHAERVARPVTTRDALKRRRANVLFVLALTAASTLFLAATTRSQPMIWVAVASIVALVGYVCLLGQLRQRELEPHPGTRVAPGAASNPRGPSAPERTPGHPGPPPGRQPPGRRPPPVGRPLVARGLSSAERHPPGAVRPGTLLARRGAVAQLVERNNRTVEARGSIPLSST